MEITVYHQPSVPASLPPPGTGALADLVASMPAESWAQFTGFSGADVALASPGSSIGNQITNFAGATAYDRVRKRVLYNGGGHGVLPQFSQFDLASSVVSQLLNPSMGNHPYQHVAVSDTGDVYLLVQTPNGWGEIRRWNETARQWDFVIAINTVVPYSAIAWWNGRLTWACQNGAYSVVALNPDGPKWDLLTSFPLVGNYGVYQNVSVPTPHGLVFGGGHSWDGAPTMWPESERRRLFRLDTSNVVTEMPPAPFPVGIGDGMGACGDGKGRVNLRGFGQHWRLDAAGSGTLTRLPDPPAAVLDPQTPYSQCGCAIDELGCAIYTQWVDQHNPKAEMFVFKAS